MITQLFTFGYGHTFANTYVQIEAPTAEKCRQVMFDTYDTKWSMQYPEDSADALHEHGVLRLAMISCNEDGDLIICAEKVAIVNSTPTSL